MNRFRVGYRSFAAIVLLISCGPAVAQIDGGGRSALENSRRPSVLPGRAPGDLVGDGLVRAQNAIPLGRIGFNVTETSRPLSFRTEFLVDAIEIFFRDLNLVLPFFEDLLLARAGLGESDTPQESALEKAADSDADPSMAEPTAADPIAYDEAIDGEEVSAESPVRGADEESNPAKTRPVRSHDPR